MVICVVLDTLLGLGIYQMFLGWIGLLAAMNGRPGWPIHVEMAPALLGLAGSLAIYLPLRWVELARRSRA